MEILNIVGLGLIASIIIIVIKTQRPEMAMQISIITGVIIFFLIVSKISAIIDLITVYTRKVNIDKIYLSTLLKIIGIAYITEFGAQICSDTGENAIASKIELAGKVTVAALAVPIITSLLDLIIKIIP